MRACVCVGGGGTREPGGLGWGGGEGGISDYLYAQCTPGSSVQGTPTMHRRTPSGSTISDTTCSQVDLNTPPCFPRLCVARPSARPALSRCCTKAPSPLRPVPQVLDLELDPEKGGGGGGISAPAQPAPPTDWACVHARVCVLACACVRTCNLSFSLPVVIQALPYLTPRLSPRL